MIESPIVCLDVRMYPFDLLTYKLDPVLVAINEISGNLAHTEACEAQIEMDRNPRVSLDPYLRDLLLTLVRESTPLAQVSIKMLAAAQAKWGDSPGNNQYCYRMNDHETTSAYRTVRREMGIPQRSIAEENLDRWLRNLNPETPLCVSPPTLLRDSCLFYQAHVEGVTDRFCAIISTPEMRKMAWKYGHNKQVLMDGTFGVCSARTLLFIGMAINDDNHGVPIFFIFFTATAGAKLASSDYSGALLTEYLGHWKQKMGKNDAGEEFNIEVANTDNDARERNALQANWSTAFLILCMFHVWQAWKNSLNKHVRGVAKGPERQSVRSHMGRFLMRLLKEITVFEEAVIAYNTELVYFQELGQRADELSKKKSKAGLGFLGYLQAFLRSKAYWETWSPGGAIEAAKRLNIPVDKVARTNNHLESFNGRIKHSLISGYMNSSGRLPRIDVWFLVLITKVLPAFFEKLREQKNIQNYYQNLRHISPTASSGQALNAPQSSSSNAPPAMEPNDSGVRADLERLDVLLEEFLEEQDDVGEEDAEGEQDDNLDAIDVDLLPLPSPGFAPPTGVPEISTPSSQSVFEVTLESSARFEASMLFSNSVSSSVDSSWAYFSPGTPACDTESDDYDQLFSDNLQLSVLSTESSSSSLGPFSPPELIFETSSTFSSTASSPEHSLSPQSIASQVYSPRSVSSSPSSPIESFTTESESIAPEVDQYSLWNDDAVDSAIIQDLPGNITIPFPFTSAQQPAEVSAFDLLRIAPKPTTQNLEKPSRDGHSSKIATITSIILAAEDSIMTQLKALQDLDGSVDIEPYLSPSIRARLFCTPSALPVPTTPSLPETSDSPIRKTSQSLPIALPMVPVNEKRRLVPFETITKSSRIQSHGIR